jgi:SAM-dependent methyltransferase
MPCQGFDPALELDSERVDRFQRQMLGALNGAALALMASIGHRAGLFDVMSRMEPASSGAIAGAAGLDERYVREWLAAMVTSGVVECSAIDERYSLPREHAAMLTRGSRPENLAATCQWIPALAAIEDRILECFERGGGVARSAFARFHSLVADACAETLVATLLHHVLPLANGLTAALTRGIEVLDVGCGSGRALNYLASQFPKSHFTGYDPAALDIETARSEARERVLKNVRFAVRDPAWMEDVDAFDCVTALDLIHDYWRTDEVLRGISRALRPAGYLLIRDVACTSHPHGDSPSPLAPFLYTVSCLHCMSVSLADGGPGLGAMWSSEAALRRLAEAGFAHVELRQLARDAVSLYVVARK